MRKHSIKAALTKVLNGTVLCRPRGLDCAADAHALGSYRFRCFSDLPRFLWRRLNQWFAISEPMNDLALVVYDVNEAINRIVDFDQHKARRNRTLPSRPPLAVAPDFLGVHASSPIGFCFLRNPLGRYGNANDSQAADIY